MTDFKFPSQFSRDIFYNRYAIDRYETWPMLCRRVVDAVCGPLNGVSLLSKDEREQLIQYMTEMKFIPGGRYLANAGAKELKYWSNCFCLKAQEDSREEWADLTKRMMLCLMTGGGTGIDYSVLRPAGRRLNRTGGISSGPLPLISAHNELARHVRNGGSRRGACWAGLNWQHDDFEAFLNAKDWDEYTQKRKLESMDHPAPYDSTNMSFLWDTKFLDDYINTGHLPDEWFRSVLHMCQTGEPGHAYNFYGQENHTLRNACNEFISDTDSDVCNLGSVNFAAISNITELASVLALGSKFLVSGSIRADVPFDKVRTVRENTRKIGMGIMGMHEWLLQRGHKYEVTDELKEWLSVYELETRVSANDHAARFYLPPLSSFRAIAPNGTTAILAGTTGGIEPVFATAYVRRYVDDNGKWKQQYVVEQIAKTLSEKYGINPNDIETSYSLAVVPERRIKFQYDVQHYVDMGISSTINLPSWDSEFNNADTARELARTLAVYCSGLRGITVYPNGARGGQPLTEVQYEEAIKKLGVIYDATEDTCSGGVCGL